MINYENILEKNFFASYGLPMEKVDGLGFSGQIGDFLLGNENCTSLFYRSLGPRSACIINKNTT